VLIDVQGVGYEVFIPLTSFYELPEEGNDVTLRVHTHVREDALTLFGFLFPEGKGSLPEADFHQRHWAEAAVSILSALKSRNWLGPLRDGNLARLYCHSPAWVARPRREWVLELKGQIYAVFAAGAAGAAGMSGGDALQEDVLSA